MNIESKTHKVTNGAGSGFTVLHKPSGQSAHVSRVPSAHTLAMMQESLFDVECADAIADGQWPGL